MLKNKLLLGLLSALSIQIFAANCLTQHEMDNPDHMYALVDQNIDQVVQDLETNLTWARCPLGLMVVSGACVDDGNVDTYTWEESLIAAEAANTAIYLGANDWRVPSIKELQTIMAPTCKDRSMNEFAFPATVNDYVYSSTPDVKVSNNAFMIRMSDGHALQSGKGSKRMVYLVRGVNP